MILRVADLARKALGLIALERSAREQLLEPGGKQSVVVAEFENLTGNPALDNTKEIVVLQLEENVVEALKKLGEPTDKPLTMRSQGRFAGMRAGSSS